MKGLWRHMFNIVLRRDDDPELVESRINTEDLKERTALTRTLIDNPQELSRRDVAKLITVRNAGPVHSYIHGLGKIND